jgi:signal transduction histidine kinase/CheY-like chemotaxis protein
MSMGAPIARDVTASLRKPRGHLFRKYVVYFVVLVSAALLASGLSGMYFSYHENVAALLNLQREKATAAAYKIEQYVKEIEHQIGWTTLPQLSTDGTALDQRRFDYLKLLRQVPAITEIYYLDPSGKEQLRISRLAMDVVASEKDFSRDPRFIQATSGKTYFGEVYFRKETEPYMSIAVAAGGEEAGVTVIEVNLKFIWDMVSQIKIGNAGYAYVVDARGRLVSHPDISLVLQQRDLSSLPQVYAALASTVPADPFLKAVTSARSVTGQPVLVAYAPIEALGWAVLVEQPQAEALAPLYASLRRTGLLLLMGLVLAVLASLVLARRMVTPIRALQAGAAEIGAGALDHRIKVQTGDEFEALADQFNGMASQLQESYSGLERKVDERTQELNTANQEKSRFLAAASHDLRQPMHALGLFVAQLRDMIRFPEARHVVNRIDASVVAMGDLLDSLLDISKLDAGALTIHLEDFPISTVLARIDDSFAPSAQEKGLKFRIVPCRAIVRSDPMLLDRILLNLVSNAIRYTERGGIIVCCRQRGEWLRIEVRDSGIGIAANKQQEIFQEFSQLGNAERDRSKGLGLGLAIVERLTRLLSHRISVISAPGKGSVFAIELPLVQARNATTPTPLPPRDEGFKGLCVLVVDDDALVREGMQGLLAGWGCQVITAASGIEIEAMLAALTQPLDMIISDYRLPDGATGIEIIAQIQSRLPCRIPAMLISGDIDPMLLPEAKANGYYLLHKPIQPAKLRSLLKHLLAKTNAARVHI